MLRPATARPAWGAALAAAASLLAAPVALAAQVAPTPRFVAPAEAHAAPPIAATTRGLPALPIAAPASAVLPVPYLRAAPDAWFAEDKARHLFASLALTAVAFGGATTVGMEWPEAGIAAGAVAGAAGLAKELSDRARGRSFSVRDLVWDAAGVGAGLVLAERARR